MPEGSASLEGRLHDLYGQAAATRARSRLLAAQLRSTQRQATQTWQAIQDAWNRAEQIHARRLAVRTDSERLRYSAFARLEARLGTMPVIEQAKGIIMAQYGWTEEQAFDAIRRVSQRQNVKVRDLAANIVALTAQRASPQRRAGSAATSARRGELIPQIDPGGPPGRYRVSA